MAWTETEISQFQIDNNKALAEVNATLRPDVINPENRIGIFLAGQNGDAMAASSVLKYKNELWPDAEIIWFCNYPVAECFRYSNINEIRWWPWPGNGLAPNAGGDYWPLLTTENNRLDQKKKFDYKDVEDISEGYFPAPYMVHPTRRHNIEYSNVSKKIFGLPMDYEWHPLLGHSPEEVIMVAEYMSAFQGKKILVETFGGSGQTKLDHQMVEKIITICKSMWPDCNLFFASHKYLKNQEQFPENFFDQEGVYSCAHFSVRQFALINDHVDLILSVSSGITVACSAWEAAKTPILQFCGSKICSTAELARGRHFELVTADGKNINDVKTEYEINLMSLLNQYK